MCAGDTTKHPPAYQLLDTVKCLPTNKHGIIKNIQITGNTIKYLIKYLDSQELVERVEHELSDIHTIEPISDHTSISPTKPSPPSVPPEPVSTSLSTSPTTSSTPPAINSTLPWLTSGCKVTVYFPHIMKSPKRGFLKQKNEKWIFLAGRSSRTCKSVKIPSLTTNLTIYIADNKIVQGWCTTAHMKELLRLHQLQEFTVRRMSITNSLDPITLTHSHISQLLAVSLPQIYINNKRAHVTATNLESPHPPQSLKDHKHLSPNDKAIWDRAYLHEYLGLAEDTNTWEYISEKEYQLLRPITGNALPSMAISTIKRDELGNPVRAKYRIVALGNLDPHAWSKSDCFAPVMSQLQLRCLIAAAVCKQRAPKTGDFQNAFCQSVLPKQEQYIIRPPPSCPLTPPNTYLRLLKPYMALSAPPAIGTTLQPSCSKTKTFTHVLMLLVSSVVSQKMQKAAST